ncbi:hypothetical protein [Streptomyces sp. NPDC046759]|uniref:hypothetical protein n=1 Tax=Streptomyces sp. NPDC046759 TaxID=3155019 RepID=UPI0033FE0FBD
MTMVRLSRFQRFALLAASTAVITGGVLSQGAAFAAPAAGHTAPVTAAGHHDGATQWKKITDAPSGITVQLPGEPQTQQVDDSGVDIRDYVVPTGYGAMGFSVLDGHGPDPARPWDLKGGLKAAVHGYNIIDTTAELTSTDVHDGTTGGDHYLEAKLGGRDGQTGHIRLVDLGQQAIMIMAVGTGDRKGAVDHDYEQVLHSIEVPHHGTAQAEGPATFT